MKRRRAGILFLAAAGLALWLLARTDDPIPPVGHPEFLAPGRYSAIRSDHPEYEALFGLIRTTLFHSKTAFRAPSGFIRSFAAGAAYPQIWLRDAATIIPASRFLYAAPYLRSGLIEHLSRQKPDGGLEDWFDGRGRADKNTTETDQETSAILSAAQITDVIGPKWLGEKVNGATILGRLEQALLFVARARIDEPRGLVKGAHTIDWGDVEMEEPDQRAIYAGLNTHWTAGIYNQGQFYAASLRLAGMLQKTGSADHAAIWKKRAAALRASVDRCLWQESRGFYRIHVHLTPFTHPFDEDAMFAMGGNVEAVLSGLASPDQARRIIETALTRQKEFHLSTISGVLLPPYARGVFKNPVVAEPYEYQNGGQWDWFGGKLLLAMFQNGFAAEAGPKLLEIARKNIANGGLFEWDTPNGAGRGSAFYSGSAGSLARALIEGYYGIGVSDGELTLEPRLGADGGAIHVYLPASSRFVSYDYHFDEERLELTISLAGDGTAKGTIRTLWPRCARDGKPLSFPGKIDVRRDGAAVPYQVEKIGKDTYVCVETDGRHRTLKIRPNTKSSR